MTDLTTDMIICREASLGAEQCGQVRSKLERLRTDSEEILVCLKYLDWRVNNGNNNQ